MSTMMEPTPIRAIVEQHAEEAAFLWLLRDAAVHSPHYDLSDLIDLEERLEAHFDGLIVAGSKGNELAAEALAIGESGEVFTACALALETGDGKLLAEAANAAANEENTRALHSAIGWVSTEKFRAFGVPLLNANKLDYQLLGLAGCALHRLDPGERLGSLILANEPRLRLRAIRAAGELRRRDVLPALRQIDVDDETTRFWTNWSRLMLGDVTALKPMCAFALAEAPHQLRAMQLVLRAMPVASSHELLRFMRPQTEQTRQLLIGAGIVGDPLYLDWLIKQMDNPGLARVAGEAFSMITGVDLASEDLDKDAPEDIPGAPNDNPEDENVAMDSDEDLPWPDPEAVQGWLDTNQLRFPAGTRYLCGKPITRENCLRVLRSGHQRQRAAAAVELALLHPDQRLFETRAPGKRQRAVLDAMGV